MIPEHKRRPRIKSPLSKLPRFSNWPRVISFVAILLISFPALAGYTHYYTWKKAPDDAAVKACIADMNRLIEARKDILVSPDLPESKPGKLALSSTNVDFNGIGDDAHEPFVFPYVMPEHQSFNFCKTAYKPYDEVVTACLIAARDHFPPSVLEISSDGSWADWSAGAKLYSSVFGRPARNPLAVPDFELPVFLKRRFLFNAAVLAVIFLAVLGFFVWQKIANRRSKAWRQSFE